MSRSLTAPSFCEVLAFHILLRKIRPRQYNGNNRNGNRQGTFHEALFLSTVSRSYCANACLQLRCKIVALDSPDICLVTSRKYISGIPAKPHTGYALHSAGMVDFPVQTNQSLAIRVCQTQDQCRHQTIVMYKIKKKETLANTN